MNPFNYNIGSNFNKDNDNNNIFNGTIIVDFEQVLLIILSSGLLTF